MKLTCSINTKLLVIYAIQSLGGGIAFYISLFLKTHTPLDALMISSVISANSIGNIFGSYLGGYISDKHNASYGLKLGLGIQGFSLFCLIFMTHFYAIFFIMASMGVGSYLYITSSNFILNSRFNTNEANRIKIISKQYIISNVGMFFAAILIGYCAEGYFFSIFMFVSFLISTIAVTLKPLDKIACEDGTPTIERHSSAGPHSAYYCIGLLSIGLMGIIYSQLKIGYPLFLKAMFGNIDTGYLMSINPLIILCFQGFIIKNSAKLNEMLSLALGFIFLGGSFFILNGSISMEHILLFCILMTIGESLVATYAQSIAFGYAPPSARGRVLGMYRSIYSFTKIIGVNVAGGLINYKSYNLLWNFCGFIGILGCIVIFSMYLYTSSKKFRIFSNVKL